MNKIIISFDLEYIKTLTIDDWTKLEEDIDSIMERLPIYAESNYLLAKRIIVYPINNNTLNNVEKVKKKYGDSVECKIVESTSV